jgi:hypothetical protein
METVPTIEPEQEINPRTGLPYKTSAKVRGYKSKWRLNNTPVVIEHIRKWQANNRDKVLEYQYRYMRKKNEEHKYLKELFSEGLEPEVTTFTVV